MKKVWPKNIPQAAYISEFRANLHKSIALSSNNKENSVKSGSGTSYTLLSQTDSADFNRNSGNGGEEDCISDDSSLSDFSDFSDKEDHKALDMAQYGSYFTEVSWNHFMLQL